MDMVLLGPPGAGKGTQAERLSAKYGWPQVATGDIFRAALAEGTRVGLEAKSYMDAGELVPDEVVERIVAERLDKEDCRGGFILDGFPRSIHQAESLDEYLARRGRALDLVINIVVDEEELVRRISGRRICRRCGALHQVIYSPPRVDGACDKCGGELYQRDDDREETVRNRLIIYREQTEPLIAYYRPSGRLVDVDGSKSPEEVFDQIGAAVERSAAEEVAVDNP
jgi:adenylate kinase